MEETKLTCFNYSVSIAFEVLLFHLLLLHLKGKSQHFDRSKYVCISQREVGHHVVYISATVIDNVRFARQQHPFFLIFQKSHKPAFLSTLKKEEEEEEEEEEEASNRTEGSPNFGFERSPMMTITLSLSSGLIVRPHASRFI